MSYRSALARASRFLSPQRATMAADRKRPPPASPAPGSTGFPGRYRRQPPAAVSAPGRAADPETPGARPASRPPPRVPLIDRRVIGPPQVVPDILQPHDHPYAGDP